jgi:DNA-binding protein H-NS
MAKITNSQIQALTLKEAVKLRETLDNHIEGLQEAQKAEVLEKVNKMLDEAGLTTSDLKPPKKTRRKSSGKPIPTKYQHPTDTSLKWSGRGRPKRWVKTWLEENPENKLEDIEIK